jgi:hypothetical protein
MRKLTEKEKLFRALIRRGYLVLKRSGHCLNTKTGRVLGNARNGKDGYRQISCIHPATGKQYTILLHVFVWLIFKGPVPKGLELNHIDGDKGNPRLSNLELMTHSRNLEHAVAEGLYVPAFGEGKPAAILTDKRVIRLRKLWKSWQGYQTDFRKLHAPDVADPTLRKVLDGRTWTHLEL